MSLYRFVNNVTGASITTLGVGIDAVEVSLTLAADVATLPSAGSFDLLIYDELIHVGARSGVTCSSLTRGYGGTTATVHAGGEQIYVPLTAQGLLAAPGPKTTSGDMEYLGADLRPVRLAAPGDGDYATRWTSSVPTWVASGGGGDALVANPLSQFAATTSLQLKDTISDETGSGVLVFATAPTLVAPLTLTGAVGAVALTIAGATQTASFPVISAAQTWNSAGVTFTGFTLNVTDTASAAASLVADFKINAASVFAITKTGLSFPVTGSSGAPNLSFTGAKIYNAGSTLWLVGGSDNFVGLESGHDGRLKFSSNGDVVILRDAANVLAQRNGTAAQKVRFYNTFTTVETAGEWFELDWQTEANVCNVTTRKGSSTGTLRGMKIGASTITPLGFYGITPIVQGASVANATGGAITDIEARAAINALISRIEATGLIATV